MLWLVLLETIQVMATIYMPSSVPNPKVYGENLYVSNPDGLLSDITVENINMMTQRLEQDLDVEMAVVVIGCYDTTKTDISNFAINLFNRWGIGHSEKNTGILVLLVSDTRDIRILTGAGMENVLTDEMCGKILDDNIPYIVEEGFDSGIMHIISDIVRILHSEPAISQLKQINRTAMMSPVIKYAGVIIVIVIITVTVAMLISKRRRRTRY